MNAAEDGAVFTLLDDTTLSNNVKICDNNKTVTLNLNGHSIEDGRAFWVGGTAVWDAERTGKLIITGKGDIRPPLNIWRSGAIDLSGWKDGTKNACNPFGAMCVFTQRKIHLSNLCGFFCSLEQKIFIFQD